MSHEITERIDHNIKSRPKSIGEIIDMLNNEKLLLKPFFQRKLVWRKEHKIEFIKTILYNYPFPEIYFSDAANDQNLLGKKQWVIDGQQRINAIYEYFNSDGDFKIANSKIPSFDSLNESQKKEFLNYEVSIRDLGEMSEDLVRLIFTRINMTEFNLNAMEILNASYATTALFLFTRQCIDESFEFDDYYLEEFKEDELNPNDRNFILSFFNTHSIFTKNDSKRMQDIQYFISLILTIEKGYFHRNNEVLKAFESPYTNDKLKNTVLPSLKKIMSFIFDLNLGNKSFWTSKVNMFTLIIELSKFDKFENLDINKVKNILLDMEKKYKLFKENKDRQDISNDERKYFNNSLQGVNDKDIRKSRGDYLSLLLIDCLK